MAATVTALGTANTSNALATFTTAVAAEVGDYIVVFGGGNLSSAISLTVSDTLGNTYTSQTESATASTPVERINVAVCAVTTRVPSGSTITCNIASGARGNQTFCAAVITGLASSALDKSPTPTVSSSSGSTVTWPATGTLTQADEVELAFVMAGTNTASISTMTGWTAVNSVTSAARTGSLRYRIVSSTTTATPSATIAASTSWAANLVTLKIAATESHTTTGTVGVDLAVTGTAVKAAATTGTVGVGLGPAAGDGKTVTRAGTVGVNLATAGAGSKHGAAAGAVGLAFTGTATVTKSRTVAGAVSVNLAPALAASKSENATPTTIGTTSLALAVTGTARKTVTRAGTIGLAVATTGAAVKTGATAGGFLLGVGLVGAAAKQGGATAAINLGLALAAAGVKLRTPRDVHLAGVLEPSRYTATVDPDRYLAAVEAP